MSLINKDPDKPSEVTLEQVKIAKQCGFQLANVILTDDDGGVLSFVAAMPFIPRVGEIIVIEDGKCCEVKGASYKVSTIKVGNTAIKYLGANIYACVVPSQEEKDQYYYDSL